jgi:hypothetical protein
MVEFNKWCNKNEIVLKYLYYKLLSICDDYNLKLIDNEKCYENYLKMMYNSSSKSIIDKTLFPEFYDNLSGFA